VCARVCAPCCTIYAAVVCMGLCWRLCCGCSLSAKRTRQVRAFTSWNTPGPLTQQAQPGKCADGYCTSREWSGDLAEEFWAAAIIMCSETLRQSRALNIVCHSTSFCYEPMSSFSTGGALGDPGPEFAWQQFCRESGPAARCHGWAWGSLCEVLWEVINARSSRPHEEGFAKENISSNRPPVHSGLFSQLFKAKELDSCTKPNNCCCKSATPWKSQKINLFLICIHRPPT
jgi:hypothetical protein